MNVLTLCHVLIMTSTVVSFANTTTKNLTAGSVPEKSVLIGAYYNDHKGGDISILEKKVKRTFAINYVYQNFNWTNKKSNRAIEADIKVGRTPVVAWQVGVETKDGKKTCATARDISDGVYDQSLKVQAKKINDLKVPIILDFVPEMTNQKESTYNLLDCFYGPHWFESDDSVMKAGEAYIQAARHIVKLFRAENASNAQWIFGPSGRAFQNMIKGKLEWTHFYPGDEYVDWIGVDRFMTSIMPIRFEDDIVVQNFYEATSKLGKPLMIIQTTALADKRKKMDPQTVWVQSAMETIPKQFPRIHGYMFNNNTIRKSPHLLGETRLALQGKGLEAFIKMAKDPAFQAKDTKSFLK